MRGGRAFWLSQERLDTITACFLEGATHRACAKAVGCSQATVNGYYQRLRAGEILKSREHGWRWGQRGGHVDKPITPRPKRKKPLNNPSRFYTSNFEPA